MAQLDRMTRLARLQRLVMAAGGSIDGRKKFHKLAYICEYLGLDLDQSFVFHYYGVYSPSLASDLEVATQWAVLEEQTIGDAYRIRLGKDLIDEREAGLVAQPNAFSLVGELAGEAATTLEVLTTILYLHANGYRDGELASKLMRLKGHLKTVFPRANQLAREHFSVAVDDEAQVAW